MRTLTYQQAIKEALSQLMEQDERIFLIGQGLDSPWSFGDTTLGLIDQFGPRRVYDPPIAENGLTGVAVGAAMAGMRPIVMHPRMDFMYYAMDQIVNHAANWNYMTNGRVSVPVVIRGVVNRGNEQAAQHSQSPHALYAHIPGLKVVMPASPVDAKGLLVAAVRDPDPVIYIDERWLYRMSGEVPEDLYETPIGSANVVRAGTDLTLVALSYALPMALTAAEQLATERVSVEVIDPRTVKPLDRATLLASVHKTGRLVVVDSGWTSFGVSAEILATVTESAFASLKAPPRRIASPDTPIPASQTLEQAFYIDTARILAGVREAMRA